MSPRTFTLILAAAAAFLPPAFAGVRVVHKIFPGGATAALKVDTYRGAIDVQASPDDAFHIEIALDSGTDDPAKSDKLLRNVHMDFRQDGPAIAVVLRNPSETGRHLDVGDEGQKVAVDCRFLVPRNCDLDLVSADGSVNVGDLSGRMKAKTKNGTLFFGHIDGDIEATGEKGDVIVSHCMGSAKLKVVLGNIRAGTIAGRVEGKSTNGDIEVQHALGGASLSARAGDVSLGLPKMFSQEAEVDTDGGAILLRLDPETRCTIQAKSVWGHIHVNPLLPIQSLSGANGHANWIGVLNGGGTLIALHASGGQVRIEPPKG